MNLAKWGTVAVGTLVVFALGLWLGGSRLMGASQPAPQVSVAPQGSSVPPARANASGVSSQPPSPRQTIPTPAVSGQSQVPLPPARSVNVAPEAAAVRGNPEAPVTIVEYSDYQ